MAKELKKNKAQMVMPESKEDKKKALECGMDGFLSKPIVIEELIHTLQTNLK